MTVLSQQTDFCYQWCKWHATVYIYRYYGWCLVRITIMLLFVFTALESVASSFMLLSNRGRNWSLELLLIGLLVKMWHSFQHRCSEFWFAIIYCIFAHHHHHKITSTQYIMHIANIMFNIFFLQMGAYHTLDLELNRKFTLKKQDWDSVSLDRIGKFWQFSFYQVTLCTGDNLQ